MASCSVRELRIIEAASAPAPKAIIPAASGLPWVLRAACWGAAFTAPPACSAPARAFSAVCSALSRIDSAVCRAPSEVVPITRSRTPVILSRIRSVRRRTAWRGLACSASLVTSWESSSLVMSICALSVSGDVPIQRPP